MKLTPNMIYQQSQESMELCDYIINYRNQVFHYNVTLKNINYLTQKAGQGQYTQEVGVESWYRVVNTLVKKLNNSNKYNTTAKFTAAIDLEASYRSCIQAYFMRGKMV